MIIIQVSDSALISFFVDFRDELFDVAVSEVRFSEAAYHPTNDNRGITGANTPTPIVQHCHRRVTLNSRHTDPPKHIRRKNKAYHDRTPS